MPASKYIYPPTKGEFCPDECMGQPQAVKLLRLAISSGVVVGKPIVKKI
jgi:hypothetical protein